MAPLQEGRSTFEIFKRQFAAMLLNPTGTSSFQKTSRAFLPGMWGDYAFAGCFSPRRFRPITANSRHAVQVGQGEGGHGQVDEGEDQVPLLGVSGHS